MNTIEALLNDDTVSRQIVLFLLENETAMDTAKGIASWWVQCDHVAVQPALDQLVRYGAIVPYACGSGMLYGFTRDQDIRARLRAILCAGMPRKNQSPGDGGSS